jgi:hypothetical protein
MDILAVRLTFTLGPTRVGGGGVGLQTPPQIEIKETQIL